MHRTFLLFISLTCKHGVPLMPPRIMLLAVHNTTTAKTTEGRELYYCRSSITRTIVAGLDCASGPPAACCYGTRFRPLGVVEHVSSREDSYSYSRRLACRARQRDSSCIISIPPYNTAVAAAAATSAAVGAERSAPAVWRA